MVNFEYFKILFYFFCLILIIILLVFLNFIFIFKNNYIEKITPYECGFQSFEYSINNFDIKFYIIAILFLLFDLELLFFLPFIFSVNFICFQGLLCLIFFFFIINIRFFLWMKITYFKFSWNFKRRKTYNVNLYKI